MIVKVKGTRGHREWGNVYLYSGDRLSLAYVITYLSFGPNDSPPVLPSEFTVRLPGSAGSGRDGKGTNGMSRVCASPSFNV